MEKISFIWTKKYGLTLKEFSHVGVQKNCQIISWGINLPLIQGGGKVLPFLTLVMMGGGGLMCPRFFIYFFTNNLSPRQNP